MLGTFTLESDVIEVKVLNVAVLWAREENVALLEILGCKRESFVGKVLKQCAS